MQIETSEVHTPMELPHTPDAGTTSSPHTPDGSPKEAIAPATPIAIVDKKLRFSEDRLGKTSSYAASSSSTSATRARVSLPLIPGDAVWNKAHGIIRPVNVLFKTYQELRAAVDKCDHPDVKTFHAAFDCHVENFPCKTRARESENSVSWSDVYASYIFMACEYFYPRLCYDGPASEYPMLFQSQLPRDEAISCILSFLTGEVVGKKMVTSRMQMLKKAFTEGKTTFPGLWVPLEESYMGTPRKKGCSNGKGKATTPPATRSAGNHVLHPFLAYLLGLNNSFFDDPAKAFSQPVMDVSHIEAPKRFWIGWEAHREELRLQAEATKAKARTMELAKKHASSARSSASQSTLPAKPTTKRKRAAQVATPSKKRIVLNVKGGSASACKGIKTKKTAKASTVSLYDDDDDDEEDSSVSDEDDNEGSSDDVSDDFFSVASGTPTPASGRIRAFISRISVAPYQTPRSFLERPLLSAVPNTSESRTTIVDDHSDGSTSESSIDIILDGASSHRFESTGYHVREGGLSELEVEAANGLLDLGHRYRIYLGPYYVAA